MLRSLLVVLLLSSTLLADDSPLTRQLPEWWEAAKAEAERTPVEQRKARERELIFMDFEAARRDERLQQLLLAIALRPQDARGPVFLLGVAAAPRTAERLLKADESRADVAAATLFLRDLYRRNSGIDSEAALQWQSGHSELLLNLGESEEAARLQRQVVPQLNEPYKRVLLGVIEAANGDTKPLAKLFADCPEGGEADCRMTAISIARRVQESLGERAPRAIQDILTGAIAAEQLSWPDRLRGLQALADHDPKRAEKDLQALVSAADAPEWTKSAAVLTLARMHRDYERKTLALIDCWFERNGIAFPAMTEAMWEELRSLMADAAKPAKAEHCQPQTVDADTKFTITSPCTADLLMRRALIASNRADVALQRETAEHAVVASLAAKRPIPLLEQILAFTAAYSEDTRAMQYVGSLKYPWGEWQPAIQEAVRKQTARVTSPWDSPVTAPRVAAGCIP